MCTYHVVVSSGLMHLKLDNQELPFIESKQAISYYRYLNPPKSRNFVTEISNWKQPDEPDALITNYLGCSNLTCFGSITSEFVVLIISSQQNFINKDVKCDSAHQKGAFQVKSISLRWSTESWVHRLQKIGYLYHKHATDLWPIRRPLELTCFNATCIWF